MQFQLTRSNYVSEPGMVVGTDELIQEISRDWRPVITERLGMQAV